MNISLITIGNRMPAWVTQAYEEYAKRLSHDCHLHLIEIEASKRGKNAGIPRILQTEGERMLKAVPKNNYVIALDVKGEQWDTPMLAKQLQQWQHDGRGVSLLVGGADGLASECLARAEKRWSLSRLTFPHPLVRIIIAEQLYRAWSLLQGHPYHRG